jgi:hypothetical protein
MPGQLAATAATLTTCAKDLSRMNYLIYLLSFISFVLIITIYCLFYYIISLLLIVLIDNGKINICINICININISFNREHNQAGRSFQEGGKARSNSFSQQDPNRVQSLHSKQRRPSPLVDSKRGGVSQGLMYAFYYYLLL